MDEMQEILDLLISMLPFLIPLVIIQYGLLIFVIIDIIRKKRTKTLSPVVWIAIAILVNTVGSVLYLIFGRSDTFGSDEDF